MHHQCLTVFLENSPVWTQICQCLARTHTFWEQCDYCSLLPWAVQSVPNSYLQEGIPSACSLSNLRVSKCWCFTGGWDSDGIGEWWMRFCFVRLCLVMIPSFSCSWKKKKETNEQTQKIHITPNNVVAVTARPCGFHLGQRPGAGRDYSDFCGYSQAPPQRSASGLLT